MSHLWALDRGAQLQPDNSVRFSLWAPRIAAPRVRIYTGKAKGDYPLAPVDSSHGVYEATVPNVGAGADYAIVVDETRALPDPVSRWQPNGVHGPSRVVDSSAFQWTDETWRGVVMDELVIYEIHVGAFTSEGTFAAVIPRLAELKALGVTAIEFMPVGQFPGARNWGYDGVGIYAVQDTYGGPDAFKMLVDAAHATGLGVILDVVYNHLGPEGNYLEAFGPYFTHKYKTPWGQALNYDDAGSDEVRRFAIDSALNWFTEYHVDGLRLDAVHGIFDFSPRHLIEELTTTVHDQADLLGKSIVVIGESDLNDPKLLRGVADRGFELDGQWSDDFHHAVHAALTGDRGGYYADFGPVSAIAESLREPFVFAGQYSTFRSRKHGASSVGVPRRRFVVAIQNHDQVGNRAEGDRLAAILPRNRVRLAAALLLLSPYVPLLFMGEEYGETNPFQYFISHSDNGLVDAVRAGRRDEFASFGWGHAVPDAQDEVTFQRSKLDWAKAGLPEHAQLLALYRDLLAMRRDEPMLKPDGATIDVAFGEPGWISILREPAEVYTRFEPWQDEALLSLFNCSDQPVDIPIPAPHTRAWTLRISTDASAYGGSDGIATTIDAILPTDGPKRLFGGVDRRSTRIPAWSAAIFTAAFV